MSALTQWTIALVLAVAVPAHGQGTEQSRPVPSRPGPAPFQSDWSRPFPQTGGYMYNDPRYYNDRRQPNVVVCPPGTRRSRSANYCY